MRILHCRKWVTVGVALAVPMVLVVLVASAICSSWRSPSEPRATVAAINPYLMFPTVLPVTAGSSGLPPLSVLGRGRITWYEPDGSPSACGPLFGDTDYIAAVSGALWTALNPNDDPLCGRTLAVTDTADRRTITVRIEDLCPSCNVDRIELSKAAFAALADLGDGIIPASWHTPA